jgi:hypothetical protein
MSTIRRIAFSTLVFLSPSIGLAETVRVSLPGLLGHQSITNLDGHLPIFLAGRSVEFPRFSRSLGFPFRLEWAGTIKAGRVVGDGIQREAIEQVLFGNFSTGLKAPQASIYAFPAFDLPAFGPFTSSWHVERLRVGLSTRFASIA